MSTVLFPGLPLPLHIFEPRYQLMIQRVISRKEPFIVALIKSGQEALGDVAEPYEIGTTASIKQVENLENGRMNLLAIGVDRVKIHSTSRALPYLEGEMEVMEYPSEDLSQCAGSLRTVVQGFLSLVAQSRKIPRIELPEDPRELIFLCATILPVSGPVRQAFLETPKLSLLSQDLQARYARQIALLKAVIDGKSDEAYLN